VSGTGSETKVVRGVVLRSDPAREACFHVVQTDDEMQDWPDMSEISRRERLHRHMNNETGAIQPVETLEVHLRRVIVGGHGPASTGHRITKRRVGVNLEQIHRRVVGVQRDQGLDRL